MIQTNYEVFHFCSWNEAVFVATYRFELSNKFLPCVVNFVHVWLLNGLSPDRLGVISRRRTLYWPRKRRLFFVLWSATRLIALRLVSLTREHSLLSSLLSARDVLVSRCQWCARVRWDQEKNSLEEQKGTSTKGAPILVDQLWTGGTLKSPLQFALRTFFFL